MEIIRKPNVPKNSKSNKLRNNIRRIDKSKFRIKQQNNAFFRSMNLVGKLDEKNELDFLN
jgi:hypothetical protein